MKKIIAVLLTVSLIFSALTVGAFAISTPDCGGNCDTSPIIVIPGIGQSNVWALDDNGDYLLDDEGKRINCFPAYFDIKYIVMRAIVPILLTLLTQHDIGLSEALADVVRDSFAVNMCDNNGKNTGNFEVEKYPHSLAECTDYEKSQIYNAVPLNTYPDKIIEDHLYFFAYNSFGNHLDTVNELYAFIQNVKKETGHDKVSIAPISMGGSVATGLIEYYPEVKNDLDRVVYIVPANDGSTIVGDVMIKELTFLDKEFLYNGFLETLMDEDEARMIECIARILPDKVLYNALSNTVDVLLNEVIANITSLWALCPSAYYKEAATKLLSSPEKAEIKRQTELYYNAQLNADKNNLALVESGVEVYNIVDYDIPLYCIGNSWNDDNADGVIHLDSTSMGATSAKVGETLPADYVQQNTYCSNPNHNHISPDRVLDASTCLFPDTTFFFDGQNHERTARNDIIISLATTLLTTDEVKDVYSTPDYPQFNGARDPRKIKNELLPNAKKIDPSTLSQADAAELDAAIKEAEAFVNGTVCYAGQQDEIEARLRACLINAGVYTVTAEEEPSDFFPKLSLWLYENYGTAGYSQMLPITFKLIFKALFSVFA